METKVAAYEDHAVERLRHAFFVNRFGRGSDLPEFQIVDSSQGRGVLLVHTLQIEDEKRLVQLPEYVFQRAGCRRRQCVSLQRVNSPL